MWPVVRRGCRSGPRVGGPSAVVGTSLPAAVVLAQDDRLRLLAADALALDLDQPEHLGSRQDDPQRGASGAAGEERPTSCGRWSCSAYALQARLRPPANVCLTGRCTVPGWRSRARRRSAGTCSHRRPSRRRASVCRRPVPGCGAAHGAGRAGDDDRCLTRGQRSQPHQRTLAWFCPEARRALATSERRGHGTPTSPRRRIRSPPRGRAGDAPCLVLLEPSAPSAHHTPSSR